MIKQEVTYEDYNGEKQSDVLYFHVSKSELLDNTDLATDFKKLSDISSGDRRSLTDEDVRSVIALVRRVMELGYGERSADGKQFRKDPEIWNSFRYSAAHDEFLFGLFEDVQKAVKFLNGVFPRDLMEKAEAELEKNDVDFENLRFVPKDSTPAYILENREPTDEELSKMSKEEMAEAMRRRINKGDSADD